MKLKQAMKKAKETGLPQKVTEAQKVSEVKVNTSVRLDLEVLQWLKSEGEKQGLPYQTLLNSILVKTMKQGSLEERLAKLEKKIS